MTEKQKPSLTDLFKNVSAHQGWSQTTEVTVLLRFLEETKDKKYIDLDKAFREFIVNEIPLPF